MGAVTFHHPPVTAEMPLVDLLRCPRCGSALTDQAGAMACRGCASQYPVVDGVPQLFVPIAHVDTRDVTEIVKAFYEQTPFPDYDDLDSRESLRRTAQRSDLADLLDQQIGPDSVVLEVGCGTGQLTNFLGMNWRRRVIGTDMCMNSLRLGKAFRERFAIVNADFVQINLFRPPFADAAVDVVIANGVLHHTADAEGAFRAILALVKPGGYVVIGLYNWLGRLPTLLRRRLIERFGDRLAVLDYRLRKDALASGRWTAWFRDQYKHPHESRHSMDEVLGWFERGGVTFVSSLPTIGDVEMAPDEPLFRPHPAGTRLDRLSSEIEMLLSGGKDNGLFVMVGRKLD